MIIQTINPVTINQRVSGSSPEGSAQQERVSEDYTFETLFHLFMPNCTSHSCMGRAKVVNLACLFLRLII